MSRTFHHVSNGQLLKRNARLWRREPPWWGIGWQPKLSGPEAREKELLDHVAWSYPHWWDTLHHTRPARADTRTKLHSVMNNPDLDDGNWPDYRKPHVYYF